MVLSGKNVSVIEQTIRKITQNELRILLVDAIKTLPTKKNLNYEEKRMKQDHKEHYITYLKIARSISPAFYNSVIEGIRKEINTSPIALSIIEQRNNTRIPRKTVEKVFEALLNKYHCEGANLMEEYAHLGKFNSPNQAKTFYNALKNISKGETIQFNCNELSKQNQQCIIDFDNFLKNFTPQCNGNPISTRRQHNERREHKRLNGQNGLNGLNGLNGSNGPNGISSFKNYKPIDRMTKAQLIQKILTKVRSLKKDKLKRLLSKLSRIESNQFKK